MKNKIPTYKTVPLYEKPYKPRKDRDKRQAIIDICLNCNKECKGTCENFKR